MLPHNAMEYEVLTRTSLTSDKRCGLDFLQTSTLYSERHNAASFTLVPMVQKEPFIADKHALRDPHCHFQQESKTLEQPLQHYDPESLPPLVQMTSVVDVPMEDLYR